eukprot:Selendium_serpulae@DN9755_c0_g1_i1.p1
MEDPVTPRRPALTHTHDTDDACDGDLHGTCLRDTEYHQGHSFGTGTRTVGVWMAVGITRRQSSVRDWYKARRLTAACRSVEVESPLGARLQSGHTRSSL